MKSPLKLIRNLYDWTIRQAQSKKAPYALFCISFAESSFFPVPPDALLIPMVIGEKKKWFQYALICTLGSVLGGILGYFIGWGLYETVGKALVSFYNMEEVIKVVGVKFSENAFLTVFTAAFTPIPYKAITIAGGVFLISLEVLIVASIVGRAARFFLVAGTLRILGQKIQDVLEKYFNILSMMFMILLIGGFVVLKYFIKAG
ncbi:MAG: DedA family protein [Candidatus Firestonebacteria bacterium]|nr:DedA family protein [Candidatus Firestonebacteria bacterium]